MDPKFQSSFIPKTSVVGENKPKEKLGLIGAVSVLTFVLSVLSIIGVFAYKKMVTSSIVGIQADIAKEESSIDKTSINKIIDFDKKVKSIKSLVDNHVAVSQYFSLLEQNTVSDVQFLSIIYGNNTTGEIGVDMKGIASGYSTIALQDNVLSKNKQIINPVFDDFGLDPSGGVNFSLRFKLSPETIKFKNLLKPISKSNSVSTTSEDNLSASDLENLTMPDISDL